MNLNISSDKIGNPLLIELLRRLDSVFSKIGQDFFVIGATARDIILQALSGTASRRKTRDLDIAIAVTGWDRYEDIKSALINDGFGKAAGQAHRFSFGDYDVDVVPYGAVAKSDGNIYWPPEETIAMSVKGFDEVFAKAVTVSIDGDFEVKIASLHGLFVMKLNAWLDRCLQTDKDAEDMWYIIDNYYMANENRMIHQEVYDIDGFDFEIAGAYWMAHDIADLFDTGQLEFYRDVLLREMALAEDSRLILQIMETHRGLTVDGVIKVLTMITDVFSDRIGHN